MLEIQDPLILKEDIKRNNKVFNNLLNVTLILGSSAFFFVGSQSYFNNTTYELINSKYIVFYPQGLTMCIYGILGIIVSINLFLNEYYKIGEGYNEFNKKSGEIVIYRKKNKNENICFKYKLIDIVCNENREKLNFIYLKIKLLYIF